MDEKKLELDKPVDRWIPEMSNLAVKSGQSAARAPTLRELLAHRGGIYSQKLGGHTLAAESINQALGTNYTYKRYWEWATNKRPARPEVCNYVLKELKSKYSIPEK